MTPLSPAAQEFLAAANDLLKVDGVDARVVLAAVYQVGRVDGILQSIPSPSSILQKVVAG